MTPYHALTFHDRLMDHLINLGMGEKWALYLADFSSLIFLLVSSIVVYYILKFIINRILIRLIKRSRSQWDDYLYEHKVFSRLAMIVPALILQMGHPVLIRQYPDAIRYIDMGLKIFMTGIILIVANSFLNASYHILSDTKNSTSKPIKSYIQIAKIIVTVIAGIIVVSILLGQSPITILAGLGAVSAILLLIFRDSILGFVAGVQISGNNMLQNGDWITMPSFNVDGIVTDISLVIVKVRNFDNSIATVPTYSFITGSFQNWRQMHENGGRHLKRSFHVDVNSIRLADQPFLDNLKGIELPEDLLRDPFGLTNLGVFRRYLVHAVKNRPEVNPQMYVLARELQPEDHGIPVEIQAYCLHKDYVEYEKFRSDLVEFIYAMMPAFGLRPYQRTNDTVKSE